VAVAGSKHGGASSIEVEGTGVATAGERMPDEHHIELAASSIRFSAERLGVGVRCPSI
jgi:hypothetical protein